MLSEILANLPLEGCNEEQKKMLEKAEFKGYNLDILTRVNDFGFLSYNVGQMYSIILGYDNGVDVNVYAALRDDGIPVYSADQMEEIRLAQMDGVDVRLLTKLDANGEPIYSDRMMWLIHEAYMYSLDMCFAEIKNDKPVYDDSQACEIFLGEKAGFDVSSYTAVTEFGVPLYSADEMKTMRLNIEAKEQDEYSYINSH